MAVIAPKLQKNIDIFGNQRHPCGLKLVIMQYRFHCVRKRDVLKSIREFPALRGESVATRLDLFAGLIRA